MYYYLDEQNVPKGPFSESDVRKLFETGVVNDATLFAAEGGSAWDKFERMLSGNVNSAETSVKENLANGSGVCEAGQKQVVAKNKSNTVIVLIIIAAFGLYVANEWSEWTPGYDASVVIKEKLRSPSSFSKKDTRLYWKGKASNGNPAYIVRVDYDAQNGFGATIRQCNIVAFSNKGIDVEWNRFAAVSECAIKGGSDDKIVEALKRANDFIDK